MLFKLGCFLSLTHAVALDSTLLVQRTVIDILQPDFLDQAFHTPYLPVISHVLSQSLATQHQHFPFTPLETAMMSSTIDP